MTVAGFTDGNFGGPGGWTDAFPSRYTNDSSYADCQPYGVLDMFDFLCFQSAIVVG